MRHGSLFSGIGGFDLAAEWMGWENVFHCEINPFCQEVLKQHFPDSILYEDIKTTEFIQYRGRIDVLTGGFPCQPYSTAGNRKGTADDRHLWPEMLRAIREIQPCWIVGENVSGFTNWNGGMVFDQVQAEMEAEGYEIIPFLLPACGVNAPHRRSRIWLIAYSVSNDAGGRGYGEIECPADSMQGQKKEWERVRPIIKRTDEKRIIANTIIGIDPQRPHVSGMGRRHEFALRNDWSGFPTETFFCGRDDGIPNRMERIKALGNAVVPQVVYQIFKAIQQYETKTP